MSFLTGLALRDARRAARLSQDDVASRAGLSRMTVQKLEAGTIDPRMSTIAVLLRALGLELVLVPAALTSAVEDFLRSGGRIVAQPPGIGAPPSIVDTLAAPMQPSGLKHRRRRRKGAEAAGSSSERARKKRGA